MTDTSQQALIPGFNNPLQQSNSAVMLVGYLAGIAAAKLPWFDFATWNYIIMCLGGVIFTAVTALMNRKRNIVTTAANLPEAKGGEIVLNKNVPGAIELANATPSNVVAK